MHKIKTYLIKRNGKYIWLSQNETPLETDIIIEERVLWIAEDGKTLIDKDGNIVGTCLWNKDNTELSEIDIPIEPEEEVEDDGHTN